MTFHLIRFCLLLAFGLGSQAIAAPGAADPSSLIGTWRLVSYVDTPHGEAPIHAFGAQPIGMFIFTADGHVSISIMRNPPDMPTPPRDPDPDACVPAWYCAYFGTYRVEGGQLITQVLGGNIPTFHGTEQQRSFVIDGDRLVFAADYDAGGRLIHSQRTLVRVDGADGTQSTEKD